MKRSQQPPQLEPLPPEAHDQLRDQFGLGSDGSLTFSRVKAAQLIGVSTRTIDRLIEAGELRYVGSTHRISKQDVWAFVHGSHSRRRVA